VTLTFDLWVNACRATAIEYMCTKFGIDSSSRFPVRVWTNRQTWLNTIPTPAATPARIIMETKMKLKQDYNIDFDAPASTWMPPRPAVTLTFDLQTLIRTSVETSEYFLSVINTVQAVHWDIMATISDRTNNMMPLLTMSGGEDIKMEMI